VRESTILTGEGKQAGASRARSERPGKWVGVKWRTQKTSGCWWQFICRIDGPLWRLRPKIWGPYASEPRLPPARTGRPLALSIFGASRHLVATLVPRDCCLIGSAIACPFAGLAVIMVAGCGHSRLSARVSDPYSGLAALVGFGGGLFTLLARRRFATLSFRCGGKWDGPSDVVYVFSSR